MKQKYSYSKHRSALSHAQAYMTDVDWEDQDLHQAVYNSKSITELLEVQKKFPSTSRYDVRGFYQAMLKVCPVLQKENGHSEHMGTECRGWFRVWGAIKCNTGYFCQFDLGRDQYMAMMFNETGAITEQDYARYKTLLTLNQALNVVQEDGTIDVSKMLDYWKSDWHNKVFNMRLLNALAFTYPIKHKSVA